MHPRARRGQKVIPDVADAGCVRPSIAELLKKLITWLPVDPASWMPTPDRLSLLRPEMH
jgi:hypothetical protein